MSTAFQVSEQATEATVGPGEICCPELVAPAGDWDCARAAVENGADAIYFGLDQFNARLRAANFTLADLPDLMRFLHRRGVCGYLTLNTLVFDAEFSAAESFIRAAIDAGIDAVIVQDAGICRLVRAVSSDLPIHASTQLSVSSARGVAFARELGCSRVILARECPVSEIREIQCVLRESAPGAFDGRAGASLPLEVFVHGALCVAYSGQCLTSEALGGRSANRGVCAQACRLPYELVVDGRRRPLGDRRYLLSPQDLAGLEVLPDLIRAGVAALKIEGRLKTPEYVANVTGVYRRALDRIWVASSRPLNSPDPRPAAEQLPPDDLARSLMDEARYDLEMAFSRGLHTGWLRGVDNRNLVHARFGKKRGVYLGRVNRVSGGRVFLRLEGPLKPGDGIVFDAGQPDRPEQGARVYEIHSGPEAALSFGREDIDLSRVKPGHRLWKTSDPALERRLRQTYAGDKPRFQRPVTMAARGRTGQRLELTVSDCVGHSVHLNSLMPLVPAQRCPLTTDVLKQNLGRLGDTPFVLAHFQNQLEGAVILPLSELNRLRRDAVAQLEAAREAPPRRQVSSPEATAAAKRQLLAEVRDGAPEAALEPELVVLIRRPEQLEAVLSCGLRTVYCDFEDPRKYQETVRAFRRSSGPAAEAGRSRAIYVAPPRVHKMGEDWILDQIRSSGADGYLVRNYDHLAYFTGSRCVADFSFNVANGLAAAHLMQHHRLERITASYDLNQAQLAALLGSAPAHWFEVTIHQHMPMFHMEHCVFCAFLSSGKDYRDCGRPCDHHDVKLRDRVGVEHPVKADAGCRNTVFNGVAQTGAEFALRFVASGVRWLRIELLNESPREAQHILASYERLLSGDLTGETLWRGLKLVNQLGVTRGALASVS